MADGSFFQIVDVHLTDNASLDFSLLYDPMSSNFQQHAAEDDQHITSADFLLEESVQQEMTALGLPTHFSSAASKLPSGRRRRRHSKNRQLPVPLSDDLSLKLRANLDDPPMESSLQDSHLDFAQVSTGLLKGDDTVPQREAHDYAVDSSKYRDGRDYAVITEDGTDTSLGPMERSATLDKESRVLRDVTIITELNSMPKSKGCHGYERATGGRLNTEREIIRPDMSIQSSSQSEGKEGISPELGCQARVSANESNICSDENIMASLRIYQEESSLFDVGACVLGAVDPRTPIEETSAFSSGVTVGVLSCGPVAHEYGPSLDTNLDSTQLVLKVRARISSGGEVKVDTPTDVARAEDKQMIALKGLNQEVLTQGSDAVHDARDSNLGSTIPEKEILTTDTQMEMSDATSWSASWDDYYGRYYFYNAETLESTWEPPRGFESYAYIPAVEENNQAHKSGLLSSTSNIEEFVAEDGEEERGLSDKSGILSHESMDVDVLGALVSSNDPANTINISLNEVRVKGADETVACLDSSLCQGTTSNAGDASVVELDNAATGKVFKSRRRAKMAASSLVRLENGVVGISAAMGDHSPTIFKYWAQRFRLFSKYDLGVKLDEEGWFSVTPEAIAKHQAARCKGGVIVDAFTGVGGNAIQFALAGHYVVAIDNDPKKIECARHNAAVYGVADRIDFVLGDFFAVSSSMHANVVFLSPPWGGPDYLEVALYDIQMMLQPRDGVSLFRVAQTVAPNIIFYLPRNVVVDQLAQLLKLSSFPCSCEVERNFLNGKLKAVTAYYGEFVRLEKTCQDVGEVQSSAYMSPCKHLQLR